MFVSNLLPHANEVWGKAMFLHLSVSHSVHGVGGGVVFAFGSGGCTPLYTLPVEMAIEAGGMHPTGMHSCSFCLYKKIAQPNLKERH